MRNLEVFSAKLTSGFPELRDVHSISVDVDTDRIYATSNSTLFSLNSDKQEVSTLSTSLRYCKYKTNISGKEKSALAGIVV